MKKLGYGPDKRLPIKVTTRDLPFFRDTADPLHLDGARQALRTAKTPASC